MIRDAAPADASAIAALLGELGYACPPAAAAEHVQRFARGPASRLQVAERDGFVAGLVATHVVPRLDEDAWSCRITDIVVTAAQRRAGIGTALLAAAEREARRHGAPRLDLTSGDWRTDAHAFYVQAGFRSSARSFSKRLD